MLKNLLQNLFEEHLATSVIITIILVAGLIFIVFWAGYMWNKLRHQPCKEHSKKIDDIIPLVTKVKELPCKRHEDKMDVLISLDSKVNGLDAKINGILQAIQIFGNNKPLVQSQSPVNVSPYGKQIAEDLELDKYINENWNFISNYIKDNSVSLNLYDIQQLCFNLTIIEAENVLSEEGYDKVKLRAYKEGLPVVSILQLASIMIRNKYFEENGLDTEDIDKHTPNKTNKSPK
jgi:hypothetical protein